MAIADGKVSLKHLVTMETLTNEEVLGLIRRGGDFKMAELTSSWIDSISSAISF